MRRISPRPVFAFFAAALAFGLAFAGCKTTTNNIEALAIRDIKIASVQDGSYVGEQNNWPDTAKVEVGVKDGAIVSIKILQHLHGPGREHGAYAIPDRVIAAQSLQVDAVSGATYASKVMLKAIEKALEKGVSP
jgi:uncharacterized protein with FMN-binding domain